MQEFQVCNQIIDQKNTSFYVGVTTSALDNQLVTAKAELDALMASSTAQLSVFCNPLGSGFSFGSCLSYTIYPGDNILNEDINLLRALPPWGYVFRFKDLITASTTASLPTISFVIPSALPGGGATFIFDPTHKLDFVLNATTSQFNNVSASSTKTLYEITEPYWEILVSLAVLLYIISRILGSHLIPGLTHKKIN